ncbi:ABC transporter substrate-binding protein [Devosia neptuniae]|uniref:ABC transporter substrate-binding protein n=1 Tax=Devosia neptuniae TaxID=191302 RepID=UPI0022AF6E9F|nr:ABC transporter substrate-binding protein [Devosia neptuniae]MCZ4345414.1 ABC transporter substrate-binding protein [Devosia neptuniae]
MPFTRKFSTNLTKVAAALLLTTCSSLAFAQDRHDLVVGVADLPATLEPGKELSNVGTRVNYSIFDTLIRRDFLSAEGGGGSTLIPGLATSWSRIDDLTLEVKLREGVTFHNGAALTAEDIVFTFSPERLSGENALLPEGPAYFSVLDEVVAVDPLTVRFVTKAPDPLLEQRLASWASWVVNKADWEAKAATDGGVPMFPVGTGPYMLESYKADEAIHLVAFDDYFGGTPTAASVTFREVPEPSTRVAGLVSGEFDIVTNVAPDQIDQINGYDDIETRSVVLANSHVLVYNVTDTVLDDIRIRQAMNLGIDRELLNQALWGGQAVVPNGHQYPEYGDMYNPDHVGLEYAPDRARALLAEAGYNGELIRYTTQPNYYLNSLPAAQAIIEMWKEIGLNVELNVVESFSGIDPSTLQVRTWSNSTRYPDPVGGLWNVWGPFGSAQRANKSWIGTENLARFNELGAILQSTVDLETRQQAAWEMLELWKTDAPGTILYQPLETYGVAKDVNWQPYTFYYMDLRPENLSFNRD